MNPRVDLRVGRSGMGGLAALCVGRRGMKPRRRRLVSNQEHVWNPHICSMFPGWDLVHEAEGAVCWEALQSARRGMLGLLGDALIHLNYITCRSAEQYVEAMNDFVGQKATKYARHQEAEASR